MELRRLNAIHYCNSSTTRTAKLSGFGGINAACSLADDLSIRFPINYGLLAADALLSLGQMVCKCYLISRFFFSSHLTFKSSVASSKTRRQLKYVSSDGTVGTVFIRHFKADSRPLQLVVMSAFLCGVDGFCPSNHHASIKSRVSLRASFKSLSLSLQTGECLTKKKPFIVTPPSIHTLPRLHVISNASICKVSVRGTKT